MHPDANAAAAWAPVLALIAAGVVVIVIALAVARRRDPTPPTPPTLPPPPSARRRAHDRGRSRIRAIPTWQVTLGVALLALGFLIAAQAASEGPRIRITSQERTPLTETALDLQAQQERLKQQILDLRKGIQDLEAAGQGGTTVTASLNQQLQDARVAAGLVAMSGPGVVIQLSDSSVTVPQGAEQRDYLVSGKDVLVVVDELWLAGAEGVAVNGERVTGATAIVDIGGSVLVNGAYLAPPYQVAAIGPATMFDRLDELARVRRLHPRPQRDLRHRRRLRDTRRGRPPGLRRLGEPALRAGGRAAVVAIAVELTGGALMRRMSGASRRERGPVRARVPRRRPAAVAVGRAGLNALSVQELTELVANLTTRNNQLRQEIAALQQQRDAVGVGGRARRHVGRADPGRP